MDADFPTRKTESDIKGKLSNLFQKDSEFTGTEISILIIGEIVQLDGYVREFWQKIRAEMHVFAITPVDKVQNELLVVPLGNMSDMSIAQGIQKEFRKSNELSDVQIDISVRAGYVSISGNVSTFVVYKAAQRAANTVDGVKCIENRIIIIPPE